MVIKTECKEVERIYKLFADGKIDGTTLLHSADKNVQTIPFIGAYLSQRAAELPPGILDLTEDLGQPPNQIRTVNDLIIKASQAKTATNIDKLLEHCTLNRRRNTCVKQGGAGRADYHVPDINVCGYNALLALLHFAHVHSNQFNFPPVYNLKSAQTLKPRDRGHAAGSRYCSCIEAQGECLAHGGDCLWNQTHDICHSRSKGKQPGFRGHRETGTNQFNGQRKRNAKNGVRDGDTYVNKWRQPVAPVVILQGGGGGPQFSTRELKWLDSRVAALESFAGGSLVEARRLRNFVHLTNLPH